MIDRPLVEIFCDGNEKIGYGHIRRSMTLADRLQKDGVDVRLSGLSESAVKLLPTLEHIDRPPVLVVFDSFLGIDSRISAAREHGLITVTLDWFGMTLPHVNIAIFQHEEVRATVKTYVGFEYILIRDEIACISRPTPSGKAKHVLVVIGGGDLMGEAHQTANGLRDKGHEVILVQGPLARDTSAGVGYRTLVNPPDFPNLLAECDWVVTNGGGCLFEAMCLGKAAYVLPQSAKEAAFAGHIQKYGAILGVGLEGLRGFSAEELALVADNGRRLVDGRGAERVSAIVRGLLL